MTPPLPDLRAHGAVLLISCYELGRQPLGLASPAEHLHHDGYRPRLLDLAVEPILEEPIREARFVGISVPMHTALSLGVRVARHVRRLNPACHLCFYGLYAPLNEGFLLPPSLHGCLATATTDDHVERFLAAFASLLGR